MFLHQHPACKAAGRIPRLNGYSCLYDRRATVEFRGDEMYGNAGIRVTGIQGSVISTQDVFVFEQTTIDNHGKVRGVFRATGTRPRFADRFRSHGIDLPADIFRFRMEV